MDHTVDDTTEQMPEKQTTEPTFPSVTSYVYYVGFWIRFLAFLLDMIVVGSLHRILVYPLLRWLDIPLEETGMLSASAILTGIVMYGYFIFLTKLFGQTLGKMVFGLKVIHDSQTKLTWGTVIFRELIGKFISETVFFLGFITIAFSDKKKGWHDYFADTIVIQERKGFVPANVYNNIS